KQKDESQLTICTRIINGKVEHADICLACWPVECAIREDRLENEQRRKILSMQRKESAGAVHDDDKQ
ncbi:hypothetical protein KAR91_07290, partial [Candidatus Pacearchaeota archaeon]|nr:hypothetical protein [Candidatus Pacearchaeota archaeon]